MIKKITITLVFMLFFCTVNAQMDDYIAKHAAQAKELSIEYGIPYSIIIAVAIVESGGGSGWATKNLKNHFGIVGKNHHRRNSRYKQYNTGVASFRHFCEVIAAKDFYSQLKYHYDPAPWLDAISKCGYSEKPALWSKNVAKVIADNNLKY